MLEDEDDQLITAQNYEQFKGVEDSLFDELAEKIITAKLQSTRRCKYYFIQYSFSFSGCQQTDFISKRFKHCQSWISEDVVDKFLQDLFVCKRDQTGDRVRVEEVD